MLILLFLSFSNRIFKNVLRIKLLNFVSNKSEEFFCTIKTKSINSHVSNIFTRALILIFLLNFFSIFPFNFAGTSQVRVVLIFSIFFWLNIIIFTLKNNIKGFLLHAIPDGSPMYLTWFLFVIEIIRNLIRPVTLIVRLTANILSGHLLIILLSKLVFIAPYMGIFYLGLNIVELFVSIIQSYIFLTMVTLYYAEIS